MTSFVSGGTTDRITARTLFNVLRAGSGITARYSSTVLARDIVLEARLVFKTCLLFAAELLLPDFAFFMRVMLQEAMDQVHGCERNRKPRLSISIVRFATFPRINSV